MNFDIYSQSKLVLICVTSRQRNMHYEQYMILPYYLVVCEYFPNVDVWWRGTAKARRGLLHSPKWQNRTKRQLLFNWPTFIEFHVPNTQIQCGKTRHRTGMVPRNRNTIGSISIISDLPRQFLLINMLSDFLVSGHVFNLS